MTTSDLRGKGASDKGTPALAELHTRLLDTIAGYDKVLEKAQPEFTAIAAEFRSLHVRQAERVAKMLRAAGHEPPKDGSFFGRVNRAVVELRSWFDDISTNIMDALVAGEKHVLEAFDDAITATTVPGNAEVLRQERADLVALLDRYAPE